MENLKKPLKSASSKSKGFYFICALGSALVMYTLALFVYLKISGVYAVATIKDAVVTSEGVDYKYEFLYLGNEYVGSFTGSKYSIGDKYFVSFSKKSPSENLLQYNDPVPVCLQDSIYSFWSKIPNCN